MTKDEKNLALILHISSLFVAFLGPLIVWLTKKDQSEFINQHGKAALNFQISMFIYSTIAGLLCLVFIGFILLAILFLLYYIFIIIACIKASKGEHYRFPMSFQFLK